MGYSAEEDMVRVDFFKESGKHYTTEAMKWTGGYRGGGQLVSDAFAKSLVDHLRDNDGHVRLSSMTAVCLEPYHEYAVPVMMTVARAVAIVDGTEPKYQPLRGPTS